MIREIVRLEAQEFIIYLADGYIGKDLEKKYL